MHSCRPQNDGPLHPPSEDGAVSKRSTSRLIFFASKIGPNHREKDRGQSVGKVGEEEDARRRRVEERDGRALGRMKSIGATTLTRIFIKRRAS